MVFLADNNALLLVAAIVVYFVLDRSRPAPHQLHEAFDRPHPGPLSLDRVEHVCDMGATHSRFSEPLKLVRNRRAL